jgi:hypothetical protein
LTAGEPTDSTPGTDGMLVPGSAGTVEEPDVIVCWP